MKLNILIMAMFIVVFVFVKATAQIITDVDVTLRWTGGDPDPGDTVTYDVYLEANNSSPSKLVSDKQIQSTFKPPILSYNTTYYWKIIATDSKGASTTGPVWSFRTVDVGGATEVGSLGDVDADYVISLADYDLITRYILGGILLSPEQITRADVNLDGNITFKDASVVENYVELTRQCDFNEDFVLDALDETLLNSHLGQTPSSPTWDAKYDLNGDGIIDVADVTILTARYNIKYVAASSGFSKDYTDMSNLFAHYDTNSSRAIENDEYVAASADFNNNLLSQAEIDYLKYMNQKNVSLIKLVKGSSINYVPFYGDTFDAMRFHALYLQSEISKTGVIDRVFLQKYNDKAGRFNDFTIYLAHSSISSLATTFDNNYKTAETPVKVMNKASIFLSGSNDNWLCFDLDDNFIYNNVDNLLFEIRWKGDSGITVPVYGNGAAGKVQLWAVSAIATTGTANSVSYNLMLEVK